MLRAFFRGSDGRTLDFQDDTNSALLHLEISERASTVTSVDGTIYTIPSFEGFLFNKR